MQNFIQFQEWAETNVNFLYRVRAPFPSVCSGTEIFVPNMTYEAITPHEDINSYGGKKAYTSQSDFLCQQN